MLLPIFATAAAAAFATLSTALPTSANHVVHEKRSGSSNWSPVHGAKPDGRITLPVRIGLTESNLHKGDDILMEVSDPTSDKYGKHLTAQEVMRSPYLAFTTRANLDVDRRPFCTQARNDRCRTQLARRVRN